MDVFDASAAGVAGERITARSHSELQAMFVSVQRSLQSLIAAQLAQLLPAHSRVPVDLMQLVAGFLVVQPRAHSPVAAPPDAEPVVFDADNAD